MHIVAQNNAHRYIAPTGLAMPVEGHTNGSHVDLVRIGRRWFQSEVNEIEAVVTDPIDLRHWITGRVVHG